MALEVKSVDVSPDEEQSMLAIMYTFGWRLKEGQRISNRTTTPTGAFTYQGVTLIHSETEVDEYTSLIFERDTRLIGYNRLTELEAEFWDLSECVTERRPLEPPPKLDFQEWTKQNKPRTVSIGKRILITILFCPFFSIIVTLLFWFLVGGAISTDPWNSLLQYPEEFLSILISGYTFVFSIPLSILASSILAAILNKKALKNPSSKGYQKIQDEYAEYECAYLRQLNAPKWYDHAVKRLPEIVAEAKVILDQN